MNEGSSSSASHSGTTPGSAAPNTAQNISNPEAPALTEAQALQQQAEEARQAISRTISLLGKNLGTSIDPRAWTQTHPWITLGSAAVGGFLATTLLVPSAEDRALRRLAAIERAIAPKVPLAANAEPEKPASKGLLQNLLSEILKTARPIIVSAISAGIASQQQAAGAQQPMDTEDTAAAEASQSATHPPAV